MAEIIKMPKLSDTMEEGVIAKWHKQVGDVVEDGELLADIETDKATMEFESFQSGTILYLGVKEGEAAPVESVMAIVGEKGEDYSSLLEGNTTDSKATEEKKTEESSIIRGRAKKLNGPTLVSSEKIDLTKFQKPKKKKPVKNTKK